MQKTNLKQLGERIRIARKLKALSQNELSKIVGITRVKISQIETGDLRPSDVVLNKIYEALEMNNNDVDDVNNTKSIDTHTKMDNNTYSESNNTHNVVQCDHIESSDVECEHSNKKLCITIGKDTKIEMIINKTNMDSIIDIVSNLIRINLQ